METVTTKKCSRCGEEKPTTAFSPNGTGYLRAACKDCRNARLRQRYASEPGYREGEIVKSRQWRAENPEKSVEWAKRTMQRRRERDPEGWRRLKRRNNWRAVGMTAEQVEWCTENYLQPCTYCGQEKAAGIDHVIPQAAGGTHDISNLTPCCRRCNGAKRDLPVLVFLAARFSAATIG